MKPHTPNKAEKMAADEAASLERCRKEIAAALAREGCELSATMKVEKAPGGWVRFVPKAVIQKVKPA